MTDDRPVAGLRLRAFARSVRARARHATLAGAMSLWLAFNLCSEAAAAEKLFNIETSDAALALLELGQQAGIEILFEYDVVSGHHTHPISGRYEPLEALRRMTAGTELRVSQSPDGVFVIECDCHIEQGNASQASPQRHTDPQAVPSPQVTPTAPAQDSHPGYSQSGAAPSGSKLAELVITGSRLHQDPLSAPMPLQAITRTQLEDTGVENIADAIVQLPSLSVGVGLANSRQLFVGAGLSLVSLRDLGVDRTLVLVNGRRQVSGSPLSEAVDLNTIPAELVDRIEVVTSGTSAVYGADAIGGVVNVILKKDFTGLNLRATSGLSSRGDAASKGFSLTGGRSFELHDRPGNVTFSLVYDDAEAVWASSRAYASNGLDVISNPAATGNDPAVPNFIHMTNVTNNIVSNPGDFTIGNQTWIFSNDGKSIRPYNFGPLGDRSGASVGGDGVNVEQFDPLRLPIRREVFGATLRYGDSHHAELFIEARVAGTQVQSSFQPTFDDGDVQLSIDNPYLPPAAVALMQANNVTSVPFHRLINEWGVRGTDNDRLMQQYVIGVDGALPHGWTFEASTAYGITRESTLDVNDRDTARFLQSLDAVRDPATGQIVCRDPSNGCVPLDLVGINQTTAAAIDFSRVNSPYRRSASQAIGNASVSGDLLTLPAGPLRFAAGAEYRRESAISVPGPEAQAGELFLPPISATSGGFAVRETFAELRVPLWRDRPFLDELSLNGAARLSDYTTSGNKLAWHGGLEYQPVEGLRLRGVWSRSVRAPNIGELFSPLSGGYFFGQDPCDVSVNRASPTRFAHCQELGIPANFNAPTDARTLFALVSGNSRLEPETGDTWSAGFIYRSPGAPSLSLAADYWNILIRQAIGPMPPQTVLNDCVDSALDPAVNPNCQRVVRDPISHEILSVSIMNQNIARIAAAGVDVQLAYRQDLPELLQIAGSSLEANLTLTWLRRLDSLGDAQDPTSLVAAQGVVGDPRWRALGTLTYRIGRLRATWRTQFIGDARIDWFPGIPNNEFDLPDTGTKFFHDLALEWRLAEHARVHLNINNILDETPPARGFLIHSGIGPGATIYPNLGRMFLASIEYQF